MTEKFLRLSQLAKECNTGVTTLVKFFQEKRLDETLRPNTKIGEERICVALEKFAPDRAKKQAFERVSQQKKEEKEKLRIEREQEAEQKEKEPVEDKVAKTWSPLQGLKIVGKIGLESKPPSTVTELHEKDHKENGKTEDKKETAKEESAAEEIKEIKKEEKSASSKIQAEKSKEDDNRIITRYEKLSGPEFVGEKIDLSKFERVKKKIIVNTDKKENIVKKTRRKRISKNLQLGIRPNQGQNQLNSRGEVRKRWKRRPELKKELTEEEIEKQIKETLEKLTEVAKKSKSSKTRRDKRLERREQKTLDEIRQEEESKTIKVTEFVVVNELANMMNVSVNEVISTCMSLGFMVTMNQRLDKEALDIVAEEFGYQVEFLSADVIEAIEVEVDDEEDLHPRAPIATVMGHVDHGKTSLLDYIRKTNVIAGEFGGITQHIGAYSVKLEDDQHITFLDTPGHEAFTAMRARGAKVTDIVIIVIAADDDVMPQTKEAISHARAAGVPIVFAINKVDLPTANPDKIKKSLAQMNLLLEDWGGKIQSHNISAKTGAGVNELLEKVLLESEFLELKANPNRNAIGTVIEASLDKGLGYVSTVLVQNGTLKLGDYVLCGQYSGKIRAILDERNHKVKKAEPAKPVAVLGLNGAPQAGDSFIIMDDEREAKAVATKHAQLRREQGARSQKSLTLEEIGRRLAVGDFQKLNIVVKGDVDGSIEALSGSLQKLSIDEIQINIIHKEVGQINESDILLAIASDAIVVGFQVRPSANARKLAERERVDIRFYSVIYDAIDEIKDAMRGMLSMDLKEVVTCNLEVRETFKISRLGTVAGCYILDGTITQNTKIRLVRDGVVVYTGELGSLKRFKDNVKEVQKGYECGLNIQNFNDIKVGDIIEGFKEVEVEKSLS